MPSGQKAALSDNSVVLWGFLNKKCFLTTTNFFNSESLRKPGQPKFKKELSSRLMKIGASKARDTRCLEPKDDAQVGFTGPHVMKKFPRLRNNKHSYYCRHTVTHSQPSKGTKSHGFVESVGLHTLWQLPPSLIWLMACQTASVPIFMVLLSGAQSISLSALLLAL